MLFSKRILVLLDEGAHSHNALFRAQLIAERMGCELALAWVGREQPWLGFDAEIGAIEHSELRVTREVLQGDLVKTVCQRWRQGQFALLVKGCDTRHNPHTLLAPRDWKLLRETPCPVLLVKHDRHWAEGRVLAAVNLSAHSPALRAHNQSILMLAGFISRELGIPLHGVVATAAAMQGAEPEMQSQTLIDQRARARAEKILAELNLHTDQLHVGEGPPERWIPQVSAEIDAALVVIGTRARKGIKAALLGNTAERILDRLNTDILVLRAGLDASLAPLIEAHEEGGDNTPAH